jgi:hypothetical protein
MKMKQILALLLAMVMVFSMVACNSTPDETTSGADSDVTTTENATTETTTEIPVETVLATQAVVEEIQEIKEGISRYRLLLEPCRSGHHQPLRIGGQSQLSGFLDTVRHRKVVSKVTHAIASESVLHGSGLIPPDTDEFIDLRSHTRSHLDFVASYLVDIFTGSQQVAWLYYPVGTLIADEVIPLHLISDAIHFFYCFVG